MTKYLFAIYDKRAELFAPPFVSENENAARRLVLDALRDPSTLISRYPEDFGLYRLCVFDEVSGALFECDKLKICDLDMVGNPGSDKGV